jgi:hypothetical protein
MAKIIWEDIEEYLESIQYPSDYSGLDKKLHEGAIKNFSKWMVGHFKLEFEDHQEFHITDI